MASSGVSRADTSYRSAYVRGSGGGSCVGSIEVDCDFGGGCGVKFFLGLGGNMVERRVFKNET